MVDRAKLRGVPHHGIGRGFKAGKEEIVGLLTALERFVNADDAADNEAPRGAPPGNRRVAGGYCPGLTVALVPAAQLLAVFPCWRSPCPMPWR